MEFKAFIKRSGNMKHVRQHTKILLGSGALLILYSLLCREFYIYFFWESHSVGLTLSMIGTLSFLVDSIGAKHSEKRKYFIELFAIGLVSLVTLLEPVSAAINSSFSAAFLKQRIMCKVTVKLKMKLVG
jgi:hypothetical protein